MKEEQWADENIMRRWIKEIEEEKQSAPFSETPLKDLEGQVKEIEFKIGKLSLFKWRIEKGQERLSNSEEILARFKKEIGELEKKKGDIQKQREDREVEIHYCNLKLSLLKELAENS